MDQLKVTRENAEGQPSTVVVSISGPMTIPHVGEIRLELLKAFEGAEQLCLDLAGVNEIDLAGLQLLCSAHRSSLQSDKRLFFSKCNNEIVRTVSKEAGFLRHVGCAHDSEKTCLWLGGNNSCQS